MTHKSEDYKISAVKYYINNNKSLDEVCEIFECSRKSLYRWVKRYNEIETLGRQNIKSESYKITKKQVNYALNKQKENEQITMEELVKIVKKKYNDFDITSQHLGQILRDNNITRKRTRHERWIKNLRFFIHPTCKKCSGIWNRDVNGATNIYKIAKNAIKKKERPKYLCRDNKEGTDIKTTEVIIKVSKKTVSKKSVVLDDTTKS
jgi:transposase